MFAAAYPVRLQVDRHLSLWLWLVKWFLGIPGRNARTLRRPVTGGE